MWEWDHIARDVLVGLIPGFVVFMLGLYWNEITTAFKLERRRFGRLFGREPLRSRILTVTLDVYKDVRLLPPEILEKYKIPVPPSGENRRFFKAFPTHMTFLPGAFGEIVGYCSARAAKYITEALTKVPGVSVYTVSDAEVVGNWLASFVNIGSSSSNIKTDHIKKLPENQWLADDVNGKIELKDGTVIRMEADADKGYILKIPNPHSEGNSLFVCAGIGEWGTSGAAWFLSAKWKVLSRRFGSNSFMLVVSVRPGSDHTAQEILASGDERFIWRIEKFCRRFFRLSK